MTADWRGRIFTLALELFTNRHRRIGYVEKQSFSIRITVHSLQEAGLTSQENDRNQIISLVKLN